MIRDIIQNISLFVDGRGYAGVVAEFTPPKLMPKLMEYAAGGISAPVDVAMAAHEKLEADLTLKAFDPDVLKLFNVVQGAEVPFIMRGAVQDGDGTTHAVEITTRGLIKEYDQGTWKAAEEVTLKLGLTLTYYKLVRDGATLIELDPLNMVAVIDGTDQLEAQRAALGV